MLLITWNMPLLCSDSSYKQHQKCINALFLFFYLKLFKLINTKFTYNNYFVYSSKVIWIKHSTAGQSWVGSSSSFRRTHFIRPHYILSHCLQKTTVYSQSSSQGDFIFTPAFWEPSTAQPEACSTSCTHENKLLSWDKGVRNRLQWRRVISSLF